jgi:HEAT repeat protein
MCRVAVLVAVVSLAFAGTAPASPRFLPQPYPEPLGVLVRDARTIHVLKVKSINKDGVTFETVAAIKGKPDKAPFGLLELRGEKKETEGLFEVGATVVCFVQGDPAKGDGDAVALLHVGTRWVVGVSPVFWRGEKHWFTFGGPDFAYGGRDFSMTFDGTATALREHVEAVLAGREATITCRAPQGWDVRGRPRLWRIKVSLETTEWVMSDESPHFVGWGSGEKDEVAKLLAALDAKAPRDRIRAADDLADLGAAAREALPGLRRVQNDSDPAVALAAAKAVARLDAKDPGAVEAIRGRLRHADAKQRTAAASALADLGPRARAALPTVLTMLTDEDDGTRAAAADAVGRLAPDSPTAPDAVAALAALLKKEENGNVRETVIGALRRFGPLAHAAIPALRETLSLQGDGFRHTPNTRAIALLSRFDPIPVELLAEVVADSQAAPDAREAAARRLTSLGPQGRTALPILLRVFKQPHQPGDPDQESLRICVARALLEMDPEGAPAVIAPVLFGRLKKLAAKPAALDDPDLFNTIGVLSNCGATAKPMLPDLLAAIDPEDTFRSHYAVANLTSLLTPEDRELWPALRKRLREDERFRLAKVLFKLGKRDEALAELGKCLDSDRQYEREEVVQWLRRDPREAVALAPAMRQAQARASGGEQVRLALTLWRLRAGKEDSPRTRALAGLDRLLSACDWDSRLVGSLNESPFWSNQGPRGNHVALVHEAITEVYFRVQAASDPVASLARLLREKDPYLRVVAVAALARAEPKHPEVLPALRRLLEHHPGFLCYTADTLAELGPTAAPLVPLLVPNLRHPDDDVFHTTDRVLRRIDSATAAKGWGAADVPGAVPADLGPLWDDLAGDDARRADAAAWRLAGAGPRAVTLLRERLRPPPILQPKRIAQLVADLDNNDFATRDRASAELAAGIESAAMYLWGALAVTQSLESRSRLEAVLTGLEPASAAEQRRRLRGVQLLEEMGSAEARALLKELARGDSRLALTREAGAALRRAEAFE